MAGGRTLLKVNKFNWFRDPRNEPRIVPSFTTPPRHFDQQNPRNKTLPLTMDGVEELIRKSERIFCWNNRCLVKMSTRHTDLINNGRWKQPPTDAWIIQLDYVISVPFHLNIQFVSPTPRYSIIPTHRPVPTYHHNNDDVSLIATTITN